MKQIATGCNIVARLIDLTRIRYPNPPKQVAQG